MSKSEAVFEAEATQPRGPRLNLAIGPSCPVRCEGCYNSFGDSFGTDTLVTTDEIIDFAGAVRARDIDGVTLSGGDPLFHPEIEKVLEGLDAAGFRTKLDTVGTAFYEESRIAFKGRGTIPHIKVSTIGRYVESVTLPLDGTDQDTVASFRKGRSNLLEETKVVAGLLADAGVVFDFNTVVNAKNVEQLDAIGELAEAVGASAWHVFEYDTSGPNPSRRRDELALAAGQFEAAVASYNRYTADGMRIDVRAVNSRVGEGAYFFVNDAGIAWSPTGQAGMTRRYGHITRDKERVLSAYDRYLEAFWAKFTE